MDTRFGVKQKQLFTMVVKQAVNQFLFSRLKTLLIELFSLEADTSLPPELNTVQSNWEVITLRIHALEEGKGLLPSETKPKQKPFSALERKVNCLPCYPVSSGVQAKSAHPLLKEHVSRYFFTFSFLLSNLT